MIIPTQTSDLMHNLCFRHLPCKPQLGSPMVGNRFSLIFSQTDSNHHHLAVLQELGGCQVWSCLRDFLSFMHFFISRLRHCSLRSVRKKKCFFWADLGKLRSDLTRVSTSTMRSRIPMAASIMQSALGTKNLEVTAPPLPHALAACSPFSPPSPGWCAHS